MYTKSKDFDCHIHDHAYPVKQWATCALLRCYESILLEVYRTGTLQEAVSHVKKPKVPSELHLFVRHGHHK